MPRNPPLLPPDRPKKDEPSDVKPSEGSSARELVLVVNREAGLHVTPEGFASTTGADSTDLADVLGEERASIRPLSPERERRPDTTHSRDLTNASLFYRVEASDDR